MVNDPLMDSERNIEARQSKLTRKDAGAKFAMNNDIQQMQQANQFLVQVLQEDRNTLSFPLLMR